MSSSENLNIKVNIITIGDSLEQRSISFKSEGCMLFFNAQHHLIKLAPVERAFFDYLCERMHVTNNSVFIDANLKNAFIKHMVDLSSRKTKSSLQQLGKDVQKLSELGLLIKTQHEGRYVVNPKYVFKGTKAARKICLKQLIEHRNHSGQPIQNLINEPESDFLSSQKTN